MFPVKNLLPSLHSFLYKIIDYAGLFPPANLPLDIAIRNYIHYRATPENWMLSRFIVPAKKLDELTQIVNAGLRWEGNLIFSVLGQGGVSREAFLTGLMADIQAISTFRSKFKNRVLLDVYETRWPVSGLAEFASSAQLLKEIVPKLRESGLFPFFEPSLGRDWEPHAETLIKAISTHRADFPAGFKLRTGGVTAEAFPAPKQIAFALCASRDARIPIKFTAGLHHPIRSYREEVKTKMHGFFNVFVGGILAEVHHLDVEQTTAILSEENPAEFRFAPEGVSWRGLAVTNAQLGVLRKRLISFGSCSFEEPRDDLRGLGFGLIKS